MRAEITALVGRTIRAIEIDESKENAVFACADGSRWRMYHDQHCCEDVTLHEVIGDLEDLIDTPVLVAEERTSCDHDDRWDDEKLADKNPEPPPADRRAESYTWTFYELRTIKGSVTLRWFGESNGYYSESVSFVCEAPANGELK